MAEKIKVALVGNPNCGKSSLFNALTGLRQKVGNYPGVTVDKKTGTFHINSTTVAEITDLPGTYSLYPKSDDEAIVYEILMNENNPSHPDLIVVVADAANLKRNLLFSSQIIDLKIPVIIALNMLDIAEKEGILIDVNELQQKLGVPVIPINARKNTGVKELKKILEQKISAPQENFIPFDYLDNDFLEAIKKEFPEYSDYKVIQFAIGNDRLRLFLNGKFERAKSLAAAYNFNAGQFQGEETLKRYARINEVIGQSVKYPEIQAKNLTSKLDKIFTHKAWGYLIFLTILFIIFQSIFALSEYPMLLVERGTTLLSEFLTVNLPANWATDLLVNGLIAGISGVVIFIPQIVILFGFLTILEDTGYMARVSYLTDRLMRSVGLNGKSVIPLMSGMACAIPAIMATRNIDNWKDRLITIMVTPFMSCSARLPVYTLIIALAVPDRNYLGFINLQGLTLMGLYLLGIAMALVMALVLNWVIKGREAGYFIMELPIYRSPRWKNVLITMYERAKIFAVEAGKVIVVISIVLWFLASYGPADFGFGEKSDIAQMSQQDDKLVQEAVQLEKSFAGRFGKAIEPIIEPIGFDWKIGIALITSFAAREVFVGTMATIYSVEADEENFASVRERMAAERDPETGEKIYNLATALSLLVFFAFAMQCMSTLAVVKRETKSWKWPMVQLFYMTGVAYLASLILYNIF